MADLTFKLTLDEIRTEVARDLGFNRDKDKWSDIQKQDMARIIRDGLRDFYFPSGGHTWSFLAPTSTLALTSGTINYDLPDNFVRMASPFTYAIGFSLANPSLAGGQLALISDHHMRSLHSSKGLTGEPKYYSIRKKDVGESGYRATFYPTPGAAYSLEYRYLILPDVPLEDFLLSISEHEGGDLHAKTVLASCLAQAEAKLKSESGVREHRERFEQCLAESIAADMGLPG